LTWSAPAPCGISQFVVLVLDSSACTASCLASMLSALPCLLTAQLCTCQSIQVCTQHHSRFLLLKLHACVRWMHQSYAGMKLQIHITKLCCLGPFSQLHAFLLHTACGLCPTLSFCHQSRGVSTYLPAYNLHSEQLYNWDNKLCSVLILYAASEHYLITKA